MQLFKIFLFYYSLVITTILLFVSIFLLPKPQGTINAILLTPVVFLLWTHALNPDFFSAPKWSPKFGAISLVFLFLGIFTYFLAFKFIGTVSPGSRVASNANPEDILNYQNNSYPSESELRIYLEEEFSALRAKIDALGTRDLGILGVTDTPSSPLPEGALGQLTAKDQNLTDISVFENSSQTANVVGKVRSGINYPYYEKSEGWYKIAEGWVEARWFNEVSP